MNLHTNIFWSWTCWGCVWTLSVCICLGVGRFVCCCCCCCWTTQPKRPTVDRSGHSTVFMVVMLVSVVGGVFIVFALMALCYRSVVVHRNLSLCLRLVESFHYVARRDGPTMSKFNQKNNQNFQKLLLCLDARFSPWRPCSNLYSQKSPQKNQKNSEKNIKFRYFLLYLNITVSIPLFYWPSSFCIRILFCPVFYHLIFGLLWIFLYFSRPYGLQTDWHLKNF